jgi:NADH dehydrogenase/NADH:ubiquinone oxidoreductase subunit G
MTGGRFVRLAETGRRPITIVVDGKPVQALEGDTLLVAMLSAIGHVRTSEFGDGRRAGFCLMGACQDCWVWTAAGERLRACSTAVVDGMAISTQQPEGTWANCEL